MRGAAAIPGPPVISPFIPPDDFARQLTLDELAGAADSAASTSCVAVCSVTIDELDALKRELGDVRAVGLARELATFVRRNLRSADALTPLDDELVILIRESAAGPDAVIRRIIAAARSHSFTSLGAGDHRRLTLSAGVARSPDDGVSCAALLTHARRARTRGAGDEVGMAFSAGERDPDLSRFVGRGEPITQLLHHLDDTIRGAGRVVGIIGDSGVGKSTLIRILASEVRMHGGSLVSACAREPTFVSPYGLWIDVLRGIRRLPVKSTRVWRELPVLDPALESGTSEAKPGRKTLLLEELADYLRLAAQQRPLVLLLEKLQWADAASWDALEYVITQLEGERILFALTLSPTGGDDNMERWEALAMRPRNAEIRLTHLTRDDVKRWLEVVMGTHDIGRDLLSYVYRQSEGNPLLLVTLLRDLREGGHLVLHDGLWASSPVADLPAHASLRDLLARRVARLPQNAQQVLRVAALLGREMEDAMVMGGAFDIVDAPSAVAVLSERGMLRRTYERGGAMYVVADEQLARVVRERMDMRAGAELHGQIARMLAAGREPNLAEIAWHYEQAAEHSHAHKYALRAALSPLWQQDPMSVAQLLASAVRNAPTEGQRAEVRVRMARLAEEAGRYEEAEELCDQALEYYELQPEHVQAITLKRTRALVRMKRGTGARETLDVLLTLEADASTVDADIERASILLLMAQMHWRLGEVRAAQRVAEEAVEIARRGDDDILLADACNRFAATLQLENASRARELFGQALDIATARGDAFRRVRGLNNIGILEIFCNNTDEAWRMLKVAVEEARTAGLVESWGRAELNLGVLAGRIGDYPEAARAFSEALRLTSMVQNSEEQLYATYNLAHLERDNDRPREAIDTYELVVDLADRIGQVPIQAGAYGGLGLCRYELGNLPGAQTAMERGDQLSERIGAWFEGRELIEALKLRFLMTAGDVDAALALFERSVALAHASEISGALWLVAQFGGVFVPHAPKMVAEATERYHSHPEVLGNPKLRKQFGSLRALVSGIVSG